MREIVLAGACRTAIGKFGGSLADFPAAKLGAIVIKEAINRAGIAASDIDEVLFGCVLQGGLGQNLARQSAIDAGLPVEIPATTINNVCGSGLKTVNLAAAMIASGEADIVIAGGAENMSSAPFILEKARFGYKMGNSDIVDMMIRDGLTDVFGNYHMGVTAENIAEKYGITREEQDTYAALSQQKAERAIAEGRFTDEIVSVPLKVKKETILFNKDEFPRSGVTAESISKLSPAFKSGGTVTAANASGINDGAAAIIVMSTEKAKELGVTPLARFVAGASAGVQPEIMGMGPVRSTEKALCKSGLNIADIDLIEANEAFAAQAIAVSKELKWDSGRVNVNGGAIALGHPIGASGVRILVSLIYEMKRREARYGLATLCVGGGMGISTIIEKA